MLEYNPEPGTSWVVETPFTSYGPKIPAKVSAPFTFGSKTILLIEGQIFDRSDFRHQPELVLVDEYKRKVVHFSLDPDYSQMTVQTDLDEVKINLLRVWTKLNCMGFIL